MNRLLQIKVMNNQTGQVYRLLGFRSRGDDRGGIHVIGFTLHNPDKREVLTVNDVLEMKKYSVITE